MTNVVVLGAGVSGLAAAYAAGCEVYEAAAAPGGICSSYYMRPESRERLRIPPVDGNAYRFEIGGGHWIFGGDPAVLRFLGHVSRLKKYQRKSAVYFAAERLIVPYPLQYHLSYLGPKAAATILEELKAHAVPEPPLTMADWLHQQFGPTLTSRFFGPFHERYTAGLWTHVVPQDSYKSPVDIALAERGASGEPVSAGYNVSFRYPVAGLDGLVRGLAAQTTIHYSKRCTRFDIERKTIWFEDGSARAYDILISTLPLNHMTTFADLRMDQPPDPYTSVLVLNIAARKGPHFPNYHWLYLPDSAAGFFRVGSYSAVERSFLPRHATEDRYVSLYVERAYPGGEKPLPATIAAYAETAVRELQDYGFIGDTEVVDDTWIDVAYTWSRPGSMWRSRALELLEEHDVMMVGRYGRWVFQGIADSIRDGFIVGTALRPRR